MSQGFSFKKFEAGKPLLDQLTAERLNAMLDAIDRNRPKPGDNMTSTATPGGVILRAQPGGEGGGSSPHPFKVTKGPTSEDEDAKVFIRTGAVLGVIPKIDGVLIDHDPQPTLAFNEDGMVLIRVEIDQFSDTFRPTISALKIVKQNGSVIKDDDNDPLSELTMIWDDDNVKDKGYFYIKIAFIKCLTPDPPAPQIPVIGRIDQFLNKVVYSLVIIVDDVLIFSS